MSRLAIALFCLVGVGSSAHAADACQDLVKLKELPKTFRTLSRSAIGPATMEIKSNGKCTCNDLPSVQRSLGQDAPAGVNWACDVAEAGDFERK